MNTHLCGLLESREMRSTRGTRCTFGTLVILCIVSWAAVAANRCSTDIPKGAGELCTGVVDYAFFVPDGKTESDLHDAALAQASNGALALLPESCQSGLKLLICANTYLKCPNGLDVNDPNTWLDVSNGDDTAAISKLPFQRPCLSLCESITKSGANCNGVLGLMGGLPDCQTIHPFTGQPQYAKDGSTLETCNSLEDTKALAVVVGMKEAYVGGVCSGVVNEVYIPPPQKLSNSLAPMLPPNTVQSILESSVASALKSLPVYVTAECREAATMLFCGKGFMAPQWQPNAHELLGLDVYMPSYPARSVCLEYASACKEFIAIAASKGVDASQDCLHVDSTTGIADFPETNQTVLTIPVPGIPSGLPLVTEPNDMDDAIVKLTQPICPYGFLPPEEIREDLTIMMPGTGCALTCPGPLSLPSEYDAIMYLAWTLCMLGSVLGFYMLLTYMVFEKKRRKRMILSFVCNSFVLSIIFAVQFVVYPNMEDRYCYDATTPFDQSDIGLCAVQGVALGYFPLAMVCWWLCLAFDIWLKAVKQKRNISHYFNYYFIFSTFVPAAVNVVPRLAYGVVGYKIGSPFCNSTSQISDLKHWGTLYIPIGIQMVIGMVIMGLILHAIFKSVRNSKSGSSSNAMKRFWNPLLFIFVFLLNMLTSIALAGYLQINTGEYRKSLMDWMTYSFSNFDGIAGSVSDACGLAPSERFPLACWIIYVISIYGQSFYVFAVFGISKEDLNMWREFYNKKSKVRTLKHHTIWC